MQITTEAGAPEDWGGILDGAEGATFCHLPGWRRIMEEIMGHQYLFLSARSNAGELLGGPVTRPGRTRGAGRAGSAHRHRRRAECGPRGQSIGD